MPIAGHCSRERTCCLLTNALCFEEDLTSFKRSRCIYHANINKENFLLDSSGNVCIIDFRHVGVLPQAFQTHTFFNIGNAFAASVGRKLGYQPSSNVDMMVRISSVLQQIGGVASLSMYLSSFTGTKSKKQSIDRVKPQRDRLLGVCISFDLLYIVVLPGCRPPQVLSRALPY